MTFYMPQSLNILWRTKNIEILSKLVFLTWTHPARSDIHSSAKAHLYPIPRSTSIHTTRKARRDELDQAIESSKTNEPQNLR
jgi:hypothetical protein